MATTQELILKISADGGNLKSTMAEIRSEINKTSQAQKQASQSAATAVKGELSARQQLAAVQSLQRQRSAALIAAWKAEQGATTSLRTSIQSLTSSISALGGPLAPVAGQVSSLGTAATGAASGAGIFGLAIAGAGIAAAGAVAGLVAAGKAIFDMAKEASDTAGKLYDLSKQTNFSVETLSTLKLAAKSSGSSIEGLAGSLGIFQSNMVAAQKSGSEMSKLFKELNIDTNNNEIALRQAFIALQKLGETEEQSAKAKKLFGRAGREVIGVLKELNGDLDKGAELFRAMGLEITTQAAVAADMFGKQLDILNEQLSAVGRTIGFAVMPALQAFFEDISTFLTGNQEAWRNWAQTVQDATIAAQSAIESFIQFLASGGRLNFFDLLQRNTEALAKRAREIQAAAAVQATIDITGRLAGGTRADVEVDPAKANERARKAIELQFAALEQATKSHRETLERERRLDLVSIDEYEQQGQRRRQKDHYQKQLSLFTREEELARQSIENKEDEFLAIQEIQQKRIKATDDLVRQLLKIEDEAQQKRDQAELKLNKQLLDIQETIRAGEEKRDAALRDRQAIRESEYILHNWSVKKQHRQIACC